MRVKCPYIKDRVAPCSGPNCTPCGVFAVACQDALQTEDHLQALCDLMDKRPDLKGYQKDAAKILIKQGKGGFGNGKDNGRSNRQP